MLTVAEVSMVTPVSSSTGEPGPLVLIFNW